MFTHFDLNVPHAGKHPGELTSTSHRASEKSSFFRTLALVLTSVLFAVIEFALLLNLINMQQYGGSTLA
jgi:hypothetical protein